MEISVLATKCRYCGETVGRPKDETRTLTISDLGGESGASYAPSVDVIDAMEAFRREEMTRPAPPLPARRWSWLWHWRRAPGGMHDETPRHDGALPALNAKNLELTSASSSSRRRLTIVEYKPLWIRWLAVSVSILLVVIALYFGGGYVKARIDEYLIKRNEKPPRTVENRAEAILNAGGPVLAALKAACDALSQVDNAQNRKILDRARQQVIKEVTGLLDAVPWNIPMLNNASTMITQAEAIDPGSALIKDLKNRVTEEVFAYKMTIAGLDYGKGTVTLRVSYPDKAPDLILKEKDEVVRGRFKVTRISPKSVTFEDNLRKSTAGLPRSVTISLDGSITAQ
jgi:uncharacterized protein YdhG (YjbR/CyaY superfamily)